MQPVVRQYTIKLTTDVDVGWTLPSTELQSERQPNKLNKCSDALYV